MVLLRPDVTKPGPRRRGCLWLLMAVLCGVILSDSHLRAEESSLEYQLKAAFLVNFARFIAWPETAFPSEQREFILCVAGKDPFGSALAGIENKKIAGRPVRVIYVPKLEEPPLVTCFLSAVPRRPDSRSKYPHLAGGGLSRSVISPGS